MDSIRANTVLALNATTEEVDVVLGSTLAPNTALYVFFLVLKLCELLFCSKTEGKQTLQQFLQWKAAFEVSCPSM